MSRTPAEQPAIWRFLRRLTPIVVLVGIMWLLEFADRTVLDNRLDAYGIIPRTGDGLFGIAMAPFLHLGFGHLSANTGALLVLGALILVTTPYFAVVTVAVILFSGMGVWLLGDPYTVVIGASGLVYGYAAYLVGLGVFGRSLKHLLVAILVVALYGGIVAGLLPTQPGVSWRAHLFGAVVGVIVARWHGRQLRSRPGWR